MPSSSPAAAAPPDNSGLAVVIMAFGIRETLVAAVRSIEDQAEPAEVVVVHSGSGDAAAVLAAAGLTARVVRSAEPLRPGGTRNLGIASTTASHIAFLADDCLAMPGWIRHRLAAHAAGAPAVASALDCHAPANPVALAAHLGLYIRRMPRTPPETALTYGASYARQLFDRYGLFRDDLDSGEDTEFHQRLEEADRPRWCPEIITIHHGPEKLQPFLAAQYRRGRRMADVRNKLVRMKASSVAGDAVTRTFRTIGASFRVVDGRHRLSLLAATPLIVVGNAAYAAGALSGKGRT